MLYSLNVNENIDIKFLSNKIFMLLLARMTTIARHIPARLRFILLIQDYLAAIIAQQTLLNMYYIDRPIPQTISEGAEK